MGVDTLCHLCVSPCILQIITLYYSEVVPDSVVGKRWEETH